MKPTQPGIEAGDTLLVGIDAQALVSKAIKWGALLRHHPPSARIVGVAQALIVAVMLALTVDVALGEASAWWLLLWLVAPLVAFVVSCAIAALMLRRVSLEPGDPGGLPQCRFSHGAWVHSVNAARGPMLQEALAAGVKRRWKDGHYPPGTYAIVKTSTLCDGRDLAQARLFADNVLAHHIRYGVATFASLAGYCFTAPWPWIPTLGLQQAGTAICTGFTSDVGTRWGAMPSGAWDREPWTMTPADVYVQARREGVPIIEPHAA